MRARANVFALLLLRWRKHGARYVIYGFSSTRSLILLLATTAGLRLIHPSSGPSIALKHSSQGRSSTRKALNKSCTSRTTTVPLLVLPLASLLFVQVISRQILKAKQLPGVAFYQQHLGYIFSVWPFINNIQIVLFSCSIRPENENRLHELTWRSARYFLLD